MKYLIDIGLFRRNPSFLLLYIGQAVSFFGTMITGVALPYQIYIETHSTLMVGLLSLAQLLPLLITALIGGVFADRYERRRLLLIAEFCLVIGSVILAFNACFPSPSIACLFILGGAMSALNGLHRPALESIVQQIVDKKDYPAVSSFASLKASLGMIGGPAVGGIIIAGFGVVAAYVVDAATFMISLTALYLMPAMPKPCVTATVDGRPVSTWASLTQGLRYAFSRQELVGTYVVDFVAMVFGMPTALFPAIALSFGGAKVVGMLYAAPAVGALVISFFSGWTKQVKRYGLAIAIAASLWGVAIVGFGLASNFHLAWFFLALAGAFDGISGIFRKTMWNETVPQELRGRLAGIEMLSYISGPRLGDTEAGLVAAAFGITASIVSGGVLCVVGVAASCFFLPKFWHYSTAPQQPLLSDHKDSASNATGAC